MHTALSDQETTTGQNTSAGSSSASNAREKSQSSKQIPVLDGLRAIACLGVLAFHLNYIAGQSNMWGPVHDIHTLSGMLTYVVASLAYCGQSGIYLFFLLSGFLLFLPYAKALLFDGPWPSLRRFYLRRIFRILPAYYTVLFLIIIFFHPEFLHASHWHDVWLFLILRMDGKLSNELNGPFWTLAIEFQFYLLLPLLAWLFSLIARRGSVHWRMLKLTGCLLLMAAWGLFTTYWSLYIATTSKLDFLISHALSLTIKSYLYGNASEYFDVFAVGMFISMLYIYMQYASSAPSWRIRMGRISPLLFTVGVALLFYLALWYFYYTDINPHTYGRHPKFSFVLTFLDPHFATIALPYWAEWQVPAYALGYGCCLLALLYGSARLRRPFEWSVLRWIGSISFSLYMWHIQFMYLFAYVMLFTLYRQGWGPAMQYGAFWCWTLVVIVPVSAMLYRWIEQPGIHLGERLIHKLEQQQKKGMGCV